MFKIGTQVIVIKYIKCFYGSIIFIKARAEDERIYMVRLEDGSTDVYKKEELISNE